MPDTILYIKNMVCDRCITSVKTILTGLQIPFEKVILGQAQVKTHKIPYDKLVRKLQAEGFELVFDKNLEAIEQIKSLIIKQIHYSDGEFNQNFSQFIENEMNTDYSRLSKIFSETEGITIEKYIILQKIEKVKELITYGEMNFSEIAYHLGYSSSAYLSKQFKEITGLTLSQYKKMPDKHRNTLDSI